ncbi:MAG: VOC family protein [Rhizobiales bacterium]|nr:VOC family protein [Hyphomicrobiales bacterium]
MAIKPHAHISLVTLGVSDVARSARFYEQLGFVRKFRRAGNDVAFFEAGGIVLACFGVDDLARDAGLPTMAAREGFRGAALAWNCVNENDVDAVVAAAVKAGGTCLKPPQKAFWGGHSGYFADPDGHVWEVAHNPQFPLTPEGTPRLPD